MDGTRCQVFLPSMEEVPIHSCPYPREGNSPMPGGREEVMLGSQARFDYSDGL